jgi:hypothetical protein
MSLSASAFGDSQPDCESSSTTSTVIPVVKEKTRRSLGGISELMKANRKEYSDVQQKLEEVISKIKTGEDEYKERGRAMDLIRSDGGKRDKYNRSLDEAAIDALKALDFIKKAANEERESLVNKHSRLEVEFQELKALNETSAATKYKLDQIRIGAVDKRRQGGFMCGEFDCGV